MSTIEEFEFVCQGCGAKGFDPSLKGPNFCSFCDGTEGGNPPMVILETEIDEQTPPICLYEHRRIKDKENTGLPHNTNDPHHPCRCVAYPFYP